MANMRRTMEVYVKGRYHLLLWSVWMVLFIEFLSRRSLGETVRWTAYHIPAFLLNTLLMLGLLLLLTSLTARPRWMAWVASVALGAFAFVSGVKQEMLGVPLVPTDLALTGEAQGWVSLPELLPLSILLGTAGFLLVGFLLIHRLAGLAEQFSARERAAFFVGASMLMALFYYDVPFSAPHLLSVQPFVWDQAVNVSQNGFSLGMLFSLQESEAPDDALAEEAAVQVLAQYADDGEEAAAEPATRPNVILVLSESFWDPTRMDGVTFSSDPIPFFHSLKERYPSGWLLSPEFAGATANVEFEILTGLSMQFLPDGVLAYTQYMDRPIESLASILARQGYQTTVVSPWARDFYNSDGAYEALGFQTFISGEQMRQDFSGPYIADREVARNIIEATAQTDGPDFVFANTAENHYGYTRDKFDEYTIRVRGAGLSELGVELLETYAEGCLHADRMLQTLVEHYSQVNEPTLLVFFGDHLPLLGKDYQIYKESGYISGPADPEFARKMYEVPVVVWSNYLPLEPERIYMGSNYLGPYVLRMAGLSGTAFTRYIEDMEESVPAIPARRYWAAWGIEPWELAAYQAVQHDILFGEQYIYQPLRQHASTAAQAAGQ